MIILVTGSCLYYLLTLLLQWRIFPLLIKRQLTVTFCTHPGSDCILFSHVMQFHAVLLPYLRQHPFLSCVMRFYAVLLPYLRLHPFFLGCNAVSCLLFSVTVISKVSCWCCQEEVILYHPGLCKCTFKMWACQPRLTPVSEHIWVGSTPWLLMRCFIHLATLVHFPYSSYLDNNDCVYCKYAVGGFLTFLLLHGVISNISQRYLWQWVWWPSG